jgi:hypothetical protein
MPFIGKICISAAKKAASAINQAKEGHYIMFKLKNVMRHLLYVLRIAGWQAFNITARRRLIQQNVASVRSILQPINQKLKKQTGYFLNDYLNLILDKIESRMNQS